MQWSATFHRDLDASGLEKWPETGPHAFTKEESVWLSETLRFFKKSAGRPARARRTLAPPSPPPVKPASVPRGSGKAVAATGASRKRSASAHVASKKRFADHPLNSLYKLSRLFQLFQFEYIIPIIAIIHILELILLIAIISIIHLYTYCQFFS